MAEIQLKDFDKDQILRNLGMLRIRRSAIYPDIDNFVRQLKQICKW